MIILTMFSRCFVGVHTPQDVIVGLLVGVVSVVICDKTSKYIDKKENGDLLVLIIMIVLTVVGLAYCGLKNYPMDYVDGKLLVDPSSMVINSFKDPGTFFGQCWLSLLKEDSSIILLKEQLTKRLCVV